MKKILLALLIAVLCLSVVACTGNDTPDDTVADTTPIEDTNDKTDEKPKDTVPPAPEVDNVQVFVDDIYPNATEDNYNDTDYEWIG